MKKILFLAVCFLMLVGNTYAQKGKQAIGFGLSYGTEIESWNFRSNRYGWTISLRMTTSAC